MASSKGFSAKKQKGEVKELEIELKDTEGDKFKFKYKI